MTELIDFFTSDGMLSLLFIIGVVGLAVYALYAAILGAIDG